MLELREYTRYELTSIHKTDNLQAIKNKLKRQGYKFNDIGRGKDYKIQITELPAAADAFKIYCIKELGLAPQTNFKSFKVFLNLILHDADFINLQQDEQLEVLKMEGVIITKPTLKKYIEHIKVLDWLDSIEYVYYVMMKC